MTDWIEHFRAATRGKTVAHVWRGYGSALFLELGELTPSLRRDGSLAASRGEIGLMIEWSWRIEDERSVLCGSFSAEELWTPTFARLMGREVIELSTFGRLPEILLSLYDGRVLHDGRGRSSVDAIRQARFELYRALLSRGSTLYRARLTEFRRRDHTVRQRETFDPERTFVEIQSPRE